uniref:Uncharacterized protein n=1 Tax=Aegilops tauschii TaxID=37682 RepID=M8B1Q5_AEGTA
MGNGPEPQARKIDMFHKRSSVDLISLPKDFGQFSSVHMYDVVIKNRDAFRVIDV